MSRRMYICEHGEFVPAPKGYYRIEVVLIVGTILLALNIIMSAGFAIIRAGVTL